MGAGIEATGRGSTPPVFIVVCNNTSVSKLVFDYVAGWAKPGPDATEVVVPGALPLFRTSRAAAGRPGRTRSWSTRPQLESGEA